MLISELLASELHCPQCGELAFPPCVCAECGLGIPAGTDPDWCRHTVEVLPDVDLQKAEDLWKRKPRRRDEILPREDER